MSKKAFISILLIGVIIVTAILFFRQDLSDAKNKDSAFVDLSASGSTNDYSTIAKRWQWQELPQAPTHTASAPANEVSLPFTHQSVYEALQAVKIDQEGNVILDHEALISLDEALERIYNKLDSEMLAILQELIRQNLSGITGEQVSKIVGDYHAFLKAKEEFSEINEGNEDPNIAETLASVEKDEMLYSELQTLREVHLGSDTANSLFRISDANAKYMFATMKLERDNTLTLEEKQQISREIEDLYIEQSVDIVNWPSRYSAFLNAKQSILETSIEEEEKRKQLSELLAQHFTSSELKQIQYLELEQP